MREQRFRQARSGWEDQGEGVQLFYMVVICTPSILFQTNLRQDLSEMISHLEGVHTFELMETGTREVLFERL